MAAEEPTRVRRNVTGGEDQPYSGVAFSLWENALEKLKALDYESSFCKPNNLQPFTRCYFAVAGDNAGLQWRSFQEIASWLINLAASSAGQEFFKVDKYDDPNTAVNKFMLALKNLGMDLDFPASKLKQAHGEPTCMALDFLADKALKAAGHMWQLPVYKQDDLAEEAEVDEDADVGDIEDEAEVAEEDESVFAEIKAEEEEGIAGESQTGMLEAKIDPVEWKRELERVGPKLKLASGVSGKEWRTHMEQTKKYGANVGEALPAIGAQLGLICGEIAEAVEKLRVKERYVNNHHDGLREECQQLSEELKAMEKEYQVSNGKVGELTERLAGVTEELEELKEQMESKGSKMSEASPLVSLKQALQQIKMEIKTFDLRIGVVSHSLMSTTTRRSKAGSKGRGTRREQRASQGEEDFDISDSEGY